MTPVSIFDEKSIAKAVANEIELSEIPADHKGAFALVATTDGVKAVVTHKINDMWKVQSIFDIDYQGHLDAGVILKGSW